MALIEGDVPDVVLAIWEDSTVIRNPVVWRPFDVVRDEAERFFKRHMTVGFLIEETDDYLLVSHSINEVGATTDSIAIPKRAILELVKPPEINDWDDSWEQDIGLEEDENG